MKIIRDKPNLVVSILIGVSRECDCCLKIVTLETKVEVDCSKNMYLYREHQNKYTNSINS